MAYKQIRRRTHQDLTQTEGATAEVSHTPEVAQIQTDRDLMTADDTLALQDTFGNRATGQLIGAASPPLPPSRGYVQPKPTPPQPMRPGGSPHAPAYAHLQRKPTLQRASWDGSFDTNADFENQVHQQSGGGKPLPSDVRADLEPKFGADFSGVKVHTDAKAAQLSQDVGAQAFTHGSDIYFNQGKYNPNSGSGKHLLAHELTHTVQQGGAGVQRQAMGISHAPVNKVQRLVSRAGFERLTGSASIKAKFNKSIYSKLLKELQSYEKKKDKGTLQVIIDLAKSWLNKHTTEAGQKANEAKDLRKMMFMQPLIDEAEAELNGTEPPENTPSNALDYYKNSAEAGEKLLNDTKNDKTSQKHKFSILAAIDHPDYLDFAKARLELTVAERKKQMKPFANKSNAKSNSQIKEEAATSVVTKKYGDTLDEQARLNKIKELQNIGGQVGHAWLKFTTYDDKDAQLGEESFGFWPLKYFPHPEVAIPGRVRHPDTAHDNDNMMKRLDFDITPRQYLKGMEQVTQLMKSTPDYKLIDYNCTKFVRDVSQAVGVNFPESAYIRIPFHGMAWDPNSLYHELSKNDKAYTPEKKAVEPPKPVMEWDLTYPRYEAVGYEGVPVFDEIDGPPKSYLVFSSVFGWKNDVPDQEGPDPAGTGEKVMFRRVVMKPGNKEGWVIASEIRPYDY